MASKTPRLSVVIPVYNCAKTVCAMLDSLLATGIRMQIVVVDDASEDGSPQVVESWSSKSGQPVLLLRNQKHLYSYATRLKGMAQATAPVIWNVDADDIIPANANVPAALAMMEAEKPDILHCKACGVERSGWLQKPLPWTEPVAESLLGDDIFSVFLAQSYPPTTFCNKFFSARLVKKLLVLAPGLEVRYFDIKFLGLLALLCAQSYKACNELVYEYKMRGHRPAWLYARQVNSILLLRKYLGPLVQQHRPDLTGEFSSYCQRRLVIQAGHLSLMARHELKDKKDAQKWFEGNISPNIPIEDLLKALNASIASNVARLRSWINNICQTSAQKWQGDQYLPVCQHTGKTDIVDQALELMLANARLAGMITAIMAPGIDITRKAN